VKLLWAPWRSSYIKESNKSESNACVFCVKAQDNKDRENLILKRGLNSFVIMNIYPYNPGHIMIVPYIHTGSIEKVNNNTFLEMKGFLDLTIKTLEKQLKTQGFNIGFNIGRIAGAGIENHVHMHIVPRWSGDTNFMPVLGETRVISMNIFELYDELYEYYKNYVIKEER
jgi:ATP adenylyltransferase